MRVGVLRFLLLGGERTGLLGDGGWEFSVGVLVWDGVG